MPNLSSSQNNPALHAYLARDDVQEAGVTAAYCEGFVVAAAVGPGWNSVQEFMELLFGEEMPPFDDGYQAHAVTSAVLACHNELAQLFEVAPTRVEPDVRVEEVEDWATGFGRAMGLAVTAWNQLAADEERGRMLIPILAFARGKSSGQPTVEEFADATVEGHAETTSYIPKFVPMIAEHFSAMKKPPGAGMGAPPPANTNQPRRTSKIGRNEPCPCGSGKKYKKCCGAH